MLGQDGDVEEGQREHELGSLRPELLPGAGASFHRRLAVRHPTRTPAGRCRARQCLAAQLQPLEVTLQRAVRGRSARGGPQGPPDLRGGPLRVLPLERRGQVQHLGRGARMHQLQLTCAATAMCANVLRLVSAASYVATLAENFSLALATGGLL